MCLKIFQIKERHMTLENVTAGVVDAQGNKVNYPHTPIPMEHRGIYNTARTYFSAICFNKVLP